MRARQVRLVRSKGQIRQMQGKIRQIREIQKIRFGQISSDSSDPKGKIRQIRNSKDQIRHEKVRFELRCILPFPGKRQIRQMQKVRFSYLFR